MKKAFPFIAGSMGLGILLLVLNLQERDSYEFGTETPFTKESNLHADDSAFQKIFPELKFVHACSSCGECVHPFEIVDNHREMSIHDHDGWYKLFWAKDEDYYYSDPIHMLADWGNNRTAETPQGTWRIRLRTGLATHRQAVAHECGSIPRELSLSYQLVAGEDAVEESFHSGDGPLRILQQFTWVITNPGRQICLGWKLVSAPHVSVDACPCAKP